MSLQLDGGSTFKMVIKVISNLLIVERIFCIYRRYGVLAREKKMLLHIFLVSIAQLFFFYNNYKLFIFVHSNQQFSVQFMLMVAQALPFIYFNITCVLSLKNHKAFDILLEHLYLGHNYYLEDKAYVKFLRNSNIVCLLITISYAGVRTIMMCLILDGYLSQGASGNRIIKTVADTWMETSYFLEQFLFNTLVNVLCWLLQLLNRSIIASDKEIGLEKDAEQNVHSCVGITKDIIEKWVALYKHLMCCSQQMAKCFGIQILLALVFTLIHNIFTIYRLCNVAIRNVQYEYSPMRNLIFILITNLVVTLLIVFPGQRLQHQAVVLGRILSRIYNKLAADPSNNRETKLLKDLIRIVSTNPIEIKMISSLPVGMYILPMMLSITATYVIVALQFNHVL